MSSYVMAGVQCDGVNDSGSPCGQREEEYEPGTTARGYAQIRASLRASGWTRVPGAGRGAQKRDLCPYHSGVTGKPRYGDNGTFLGYDEK